MTAPAGPIDWRAVRLPGLGGGTVALVTGGGGAIGGRLASALSTLGVDVGLVGRGRAGLERVASELDGPGRSLIVPADVSSSEDARGAVAAVVGEFGHLDILVNAAAVADGGTGIGGASDDEIDAVLAVNVRGPLLMSRAAIPHMVGRRRGVIVNVGSIAAHKAMPTRGVYGTSKAALGQLTRQLAVELGPAGVRAVTVSIGQTPTDLRGFRDPAGSPPVAATGAWSGGDRVPLGRGGELDDFIGPILFLASDLGRYITGADLAVEGGAMAGR